MGLFDHIFKKSNIDYSIYSSYQQEPEEEIELNSSEILQITGSEVLNTSSLEALKKFKNNLSVLIKEVKRKGKIDKFMIIRDDDIFPYDWKWRVASNDTGIEKVHLFLSDEIKKQYALEKAGIITTMNGIDIPVPKDTVQDAISKVDKEIANIYLPVKFRSTKHFTVNTPLGATFDYNIVQANRNFTIIDNIDLFLSSGYGYSVSYYDAYLDVTHEGLPI